MKLRTLKEKIYRYDYIKNNKCLYDKCRYKEVKTLGRQGEDY